VTLVASTQRVTTAKGLTWTVVGSDLRVVEPVEQYLEVARARDFSHNTVKAYARGLALWWTFVERSGRPWTDVGLAKFGRFIQDLRHGQIEAPVRELDPTEVVADSRIALRVRAVMSFYRYQAASGGPSVAHLYEKIRTSPGSYLPFMEHIARRDGRVRSKVRVRVARTETPVLSPAQVDALIASEATWDATNQSWDGDMRYRLLWSLLAETGMRLGEALALQHRDWQAGRGSTATVSIVRRDHPHGLVPKSGNRRVHIGARLDQLYADHVWWLSEREQA
jgi:site-specific recombinase XerD